MAETSADQVGLRPWRLEDADALSQLFDDPLVYELTPVQPPFDLAAAQRRIEIGRRGEQAGTLLFRAIIVQDTPAGEVAAYRRDRGDNDRIEASISYVVGASFRGRGLAQQAIALMISQLRDDWTVDTLIAEIATHNSKSHATAAALGFVPDSTAVPMKRRGKEYEVIPWVLTLARDSR